MSTYSVEHKKYLKSLILNKIIITSFRILIIFLFIIIWEILAKTKLINTFLYSSPSNIIKNVSSLFNNNILFNNIFITTYEVIISFFLASVIGICIAAVLWSNSFIYKIVDPYLTIINSLPKVALGPLIIIWIGASINSIIFMALMISLFTTIINIYTCFSSINSNYVILLKSMGATKFQIFKKLILPANIKNIISTLKINISLSLIGLLPPVGEKIFFNKCYSRY